MKEVFDVDLKKLFEEAEAEVIVERGGRILKAIKHQLHLKETATIKHAKVKSEMETAERAIQKANENIEKIKNGDWSALPEPKPEKSEKKSDEE